MPNLIQEAQINKGYFYTSDSGIDYTRISLDNQDLPEGYILEVGENDTVQFFRVLEFESEDTIGLLKLQMINGYWTIKKVGCTVKRMGIATLLYRTAIKSNTGVLSDASNTLPGSYNIWKNLVLMDDISISIIDLNDGSSKEYIDTILDVEIWGYDQEVVEMFRDDEDVLESMYEYKSVSQELHHFLLENKDTLSDKRHIRLLATRLVQ